MRFNSVYWVIVVASLVVGSIADFSADCEIETTAMAADPVEMRVLPVGPIMANCVILADAAHKSALVVDPGGEAEQLLATLRSLLGVTDLSAEAHVTIALTHGHFDHLAAVQPLRTAAHAPVLLHPNDIPLWRTAAMQPMLFGMPPLESPPQGDPDGTLLHDAEISVGPNIRAKVLHTPGHSPGSVCLLFSYGQWAQRPMLLSGDTLFAGGMGRTDLPGGDPAALAKSLKERVLSLPPETLVIPGHAEQTTIGNERV